MAYAAVIRPLVRRLGGARSLGRSLRNSGPVVNLGPFRGPSWITRYPGSNRLASHDPFRGRWSWNRRRLPLYSSGISGIPVQHVFVPDDLMFRFITPWPFVLPEGKLAVPRYDYVKHLQIPAPPAEFIAAFSPPRTSTRSPRSGPPHEFNRPRRDSKLIGWYGKYQALYSRTFGPYSEYLDFVGAFTHASNFVDVLNNLAVNAWIDYSYGRAARDLKEQVYQSGNYHLPVGYSTIARMWR